MVRIALSVVKVRAAISSGIVIATVYVKTSVFCNDIGSSKLNCWNSGMTFSFLGPEP